MTLTLLCRSPVAIPDNFMGREDVPQLLKEYLSRQDQHLAQAPFVSSFGEIPVMSLYPANLGILSSLENLLIFLTRVAELTMMHPPIFFLNTNKKRKHAPNAELEWDFGGPKSAGPEKALPGTEHLI